MKHTPVLVKEVLKYLDPKPNQDFIDCTLGLGGHTRQILNRTEPQGRLLAIEQSFEGLNEAKKTLQEFKGRLTFRHDNFIHLGEIALSGDFQRVSGIFLDLGLAFWQIKESDLGISFSRNEPLDMRLQTQNAASRSQTKVKTKRYSNVITAEYIINRYSVKELADIFYKYGDIRNSWQVARKIDLARRALLIKTTFDLVNALQTKNPKILAPVFQTLRIVVNHELENLERVLPQTIDLLKPNGRLVVISYHSGEDRIVKNFLRNNQNHFKTLTKKPVIPSQEEIGNNPPARSAKLRAGEKK